MIRFPSVVLVRHPPMDVQVVQTACSSALVAIRKGVPRIVRVQVPTKAAFKNGAADD